VGLWALRTSWCGGSRGRSRRGGGGRENGIGKRTEKGKAKVEQKAREGEWMGGRRTARDVGEVGKPGSCTGLIGRIFECGE